ncbi:MAG: hypothetical protein LUC27_09005 [Lachnospiraceae bacterium]|nr:hypothetical protein [Lachnospiraceae bacterium]
MEEGDSIFTYSKIENGTLFLLQLMFTAMDMIWCCFQGRSVVNGNELLLYRSFFYTDIGAGFMEDVLFTLQYYTTALYLGQYIRNRFTSRNAYALIRSDIENTHRASMKEVLVYLIILETAKSLIAVLAAYILKIPIDQRKIYAGEWLIAEFLIILCSFTHILISCMLRSKYSAATTGAILLSGIIVEEIIIIVLKKKGRYIPLFYGSCLLMKQINGYEREIVIGIFMIALMTAACCERWWNRKIRKCDYI